MSDYHAHFLPLFFVLELMGLLKLCLVFGGSTVGELSEETLQAALLWQVSIDAIDFKLKRVVRWSIRTLLPWHCHSVMHWIPSPMHWDQSYITLLLLLLHLAVLPLCVLAQTSFFTLHTAPCFVSLLILVLLLPKTLKLCLEKCDICQCRSLLLCSGHVEHPPPYPIMLIYQVFYPMFKCRNSCKCLWQGLIQALDTVALLGHELCVKDVVISLKSVDEYDWRPGHVIK